MWFGAYAPQACDSEVKLVTAKFISDFTHVLACAPMAKWLKAPVLKS